MLSKVCYFHPAARSSVFGLHTDAVVRQQWLKFMFDYVPENFNRNSSLCCAFYGRQLPESPRIQCRIQQETVTKT